MTEDKNMLFFNPMKYPKPKECPDYVWICTVNTRYEITAVAATEELAEKIAISRASEWLKSVDADGLYGYTYGYTEKDIRENIEIITTQVPMNGSNQR